MYRFDMIFFIHTIITIFDDLNQQAKSQKYIDALVQTESAQH